MRKLLVLALVLGLVGVAAAYDFGNTAPVKATVVAPENVPSGERQGGDDVFSATVINGPLPYNNSGTTIGYSDDYDEVCPYSGSTAPDVVYSYNAPAGSILAIDLCGSAYDTKAYVYDAGYSLIACNDDFYYDATCGYYTSLIENLACSGMIYIVIDGYSGSSYGSYLIEVRDFTPCDIVCVGTPENEPPLVNGYVDNWNGGCNTAPLYPFQHVSGEYPSGNATLCGVSGWYLSSSGSQYRDTDWFTLTVGAGGSIGITADAEVPVYIFELTGTCVGGISVAQQAVAGACIPAGMTIVGAPMSMKMFWVGPTVFTPPQGGTTAMFEYAVWFTGLYPEIVATEAATWGTMKALYE